MHSKNTKICLPLAPSAECRMPICLCFGQLSNFSSIFRPLFVQFPSHFRSILVTFSANLHYFFFCLSDKNVNEVAKQIAQIIDDDEVLNLTFIKYKLYDLWLPEEAQNGSLDETVTNFNLFKSLKSPQKENNDEANYWRCVYILQVIKV